MVDINNLEEELRGIPNDYIILVETSAENAFEVALAVVRFLTKKNDYGIIVSANRPYTTLLNIYRRNNIDISKVFIVDLISKNLNEDFKTENVMFIDNVSSLTDISLSVNEHMKKLNGKKFVFFDSLTTMLIHNEPYVFARFIHSILTRMRLNGVGGVLISLIDSSNHDIRAEIAQLCDRVIKVT